MNIAQTLLEVRKAYRLLHDYQRLALDAADYIGTQLGFEYAGGYPTLSDPAPRNGSGNLRSWAWDWLNLVQYDFHFVHSQTTKPQLNLSILLISDSGFISLDDSMKSEPRASELRAVDESKTLLGFLFYTKWPEQSFLDTYSGMEDFIESGGQVPKTHRAVGVIGKCVDFARVESEASASDLVDELAKLARDHGLPVTRKVHLNEE